MKKKEEKVFNGPLSFKPGCWAHENFWPIGPGVREEIGYIQTYTQIERQADMLIENYITILKKVVTFYSNMFRAIYVLWFFLAN